MSINNRQGLPLLLKSACVVGGVIGGWKMFHTWRKTKCFCDCAMNCSKIFCTGTVCEFNKFMRDKSLLPTDGDDVTEPELLYEDLMKENYIGLVKEFHDSVHDKCKKCRNCIACGYWLTSEMEDEEEFRYE